MTDDLTVLAESALKVACKDLTEKGTVTPMFLIRHPAGEIEVLRFDGRSGEIFNHGNAKQLLFDMMRELVKEKGLTAVIFATEAWIGKVTAKGIALGEEELKKRTRERAFKTALRDGLVERREAIVVNIQSPGGVLVVHQFFTRDYKTEKVTLQERLDAEGGPDEFFGRQKMYGDLREEYLG